ncbi:MAG: hypothetical protein RSA48_01905 [Bacilli bacterium]
MKNKILIELIVPDVDKVYNIYIPVNKKIGNIIVLLNRVVSDFTNGAYRGDAKSALYNRDTNVKYGVDQLVRETDIRNGTSLVLL